MNEQSVVKLVSKQLDNANREFFNIKGSHFGGKQGKPDFISSDKHGIYTGIEIKAPSGKPYPNQIRRGRELIQYNYGRYIVAYPDFDLEKMDNHELPRVLYTGEDMKFPKQTCELVLDESQVTYHG